MKLNPLDVADKKIKLRIGSTPYNWKSQTRWNYKSIEPSMSTTWNRTQTFNSKGQPNDKDND